MAKTADPFDRSGGHPALDFVNTLDERPLPAPIENLADYADLIRFTELTGLISRAQARQLRKLAIPRHERIARRARELREQLYRLLTALGHRRSVPPRELRAITGAIRIARAARVLNLSNATKIARYAWLSPHAPEVPLYACALAIEDLLTDADRTRIRKCGASDCEVYFIDRSKGRRRHWCSMKNCGNREKQRRWRAETI
jgi:predicted RNA-binding Zn ribbon-like protein